MDILHTQLSNDYVRDYRSEPDWVETMTQSDVEALRKVLDDGLKDVRDELKSLSDKMLSKEVFDMYTHVVKPHCKDRFDKLEKEMVQRRMFEARVYALASLIAFVISVAARFIH